MLSEKQRKIMNVIWIITDIIILICAILLVMEGSTSGMIIATLAIILIAIEAVIYYKKGSFF